MIRRSCRPAALSIRVSQVLALSSLASVAEARQKPPVVDSCTRGASGQELFSGFTIYEENDSFFGGDQSYTQGLRVAVTHNPDALPCWIRSVGRWRLPFGERDGFAQSLSYHVGQGLYTPRLITSPVPQRNDRGFADFNYVGATLSLTSSDESVRYTGEVSVGALGVTSFARATQGGLHALKLHRIPKGWSTTEPNAVGFYSRIQAEKKFAWADSGTALGADVVLAPAVEAGNVRSALAVGGVIRAGRALSGFGAAAIPSAAAATERRSIEIGALLGYEYRGILNTSLVSATPGSVDFAVRRHVGDVRYGGFLRWEDVRVSVLEVHRSAEFAILGQPTKGHQFTTVAMGYEPSNVHRGYLQSWLLNDWSAELGMGRSFRGPTLDAGRANGIVAQIALRKGLWKGISLGAEAVVVTAETGPAVRDTVLQVDVRPDLILRQQLATIGWGHDTRFGHFGVRAGSAWGTKARLQTMLYDGKGGTIEESPRDQDLRSRAGGAMIGLQYFLPLERRMSIGLDLSHHAPNIGRALPTVHSPAFWKSVILVRVRRSPSS